MSKTYPKLILGSASPRRHDLLATLGIPFEVHSVDVDEDQITVADPAENVLARARLKASALLADYGGRALILTADTTIAFRNRLLNKPTNADEARDMLLALREAPHQVFTGMVLIDLAQQPHTAVNKTDINMRPYTDAEIDAYIETGDPMDKAGSYAIQHPTFKPVAQLLGCYTGVMGLSMCDLIAMLHAIDYPLNSLKTFEKPKKEGLCPFCFEKFTALIDILGQTD